MIPLTNKDLLWFRLANAGDYTGKREFYDFKKRFLALHAQADGWDLQHINKECWSCDGSGKHFFSGDCYSCGGSGIYSRREVWLQRWVLRDGVYHVPEFCPPPHYLRTEPKREIEGLIKHEAVCSRVAYRAFLRLLIRHEPVNFWNHITGRIKSKTCSYRTRLVWQWMRLRNRLDLFPAVDDVPF